MHYVQPQSRKRAQGGEREYRTGSKFVIWLTTICSFSCIGIAFPASAEASGTFRLLIDRALVDADASVSLHLRVAFEDDNSGTRRDQGVQVCTEFLPWKFFAPREMELLDNQGRITDVREFRISGDPGFDNLSTMKSGGSLQGTLRLVPSGGKNSISEPAEGLAVAIRISCRVILIDLEQDRGVRAVDLRSDWVKLSGSSSGLRRILYQDLVSTSPREHGAGKQREKQSCQKSFILGRHLQFRRRHRRQSHRSCLRNSRDGR